MKELTLEQIRQAAEEVNAEQRGVVGLDKRTKPCVYCKKLHETDSTGVSICKECQLTRFPNRENPTK